MRVCRPVPLMLQSLRFRPRSSGGLWAARDCLSGLCAATPPLALTRLQR